MSTPIGTLARCSRGSGHGTRPHAPCLAVLAAPSGPWDWLWWQRTTRGLTPGSGGRLEARRHGCASLPEEPPARPGIRATICSSEGWRPGRRAAVKVSRLISLGEPLEEASGED